MAANNADQVFTKLARTAYVVLLRAPNGKLTLVLEPGLNKVWSGKGVFGKKMGDVLVKEAAAEGLKAEVRTWEEAEKLLVEDFGGRELFEKALYDRLVTKHQQQGQPPPNRIPLKE